MLSSYALPPAVRDRNAANHADNIGRLPAVGKVEDFPRARFPAALSPEAEPLWKETLSSVGVNSNSRFFTDCYHEAALINLPWVVQRQQQVLRRLPFRSLAPLIPQRSVFADILKYIYKSDI
jgi:hypothetical protein